jgi:hypothetical protein
MDSLSLSLDIWPQQVDPVTMLTVGWGFDGCLFNLSGYLKNCFLFFFVFSLSADVFPLVRCSFSQFEVELWCPRNAVKFFELKWKDWKTPLKSGHGDFECNGMSNGQNRTKQTFFCVLCFFLLFSGEAKKRFVDVILRARDLPLGTTRGQWVLCLDQKRNNEQRQAIEAKWYTK